MCIAGDIQVLAGIIGGARCGAVTEAMRTEGWNVHVSSDVEEVLRLAETRSYHMVVVASDAPRDLPRALVRTLLSLQADMAMIFLLPDRSRADDCLALMGAMSDQLHDLDCPPADLMAVLKIELESVLSSRPRYVVMCVDDDEDFLLSLKSFLPHRLAAALPRFALDFEFFVSPLEALAVAKAMTGRRLAAAICDQVMPEMVGTELLARLRDLCPGVQRVLLTGYADLDSAVTAINEQILDKYFYKPIEDPADFAGSIRHLIEEHHLRLRENAQRGRLMGQFEYIRAISAAQDVERALSFTVQFLREQLRCRQVMVALVKDGELAVRIGLQLPKDLTVGDLPAYNGVCQWVFRHRRPLLAATRDDLPPEVVREAFESPPLMAVPLACGDAPLGVILAAGRVGNQEFTRDERMVMSFVADTTSVTVGGLEDHKAIENHYFGTMASLMETVEAKDNYTRGHTDRVTQLAVALAKTTGVRGKELEDIRHAAALHDIGKIAVPDTVISKPGRLSEEEYSVMKEHPARADKILWHLEFLSEARMIIRSHHERYDGQGDPVGLAGEEIPLGARILALVDSYDAMTSARPYRSAIGHDEALQEIAENAGTQFDPGLIAAFLKIVDHPPARQEKPGNDIAPVLTEEHAA